MKMVEMKLRIKKKEEEEREREASGGVKKKENGNRFYSIPSECAAYWIWKLQEYWFNNISSGFGEHIAHCTATTYNVYAYD